MENTKDIEEDQDTEEVIAEKEFELQYGQDLWDSLHIIENQTNER